MRPASPWRWVLGAVASAALVNGLLFALDLRTGGSGQRSRAEFPLLPPAWVIGLVWTVLLAFMGWAQALVLRSRERGLHGLVPLLYFNCLLYPVYTAGFTNEAVGVAGNLLTLALAAYVAGRLQVATRLGAALMGCVALWALFASFATYRLPG